MFWIKILKEKVCPTDTQDHILLTASPTQQIAQHVLNEDPEGKISQQTDRGLICPLQHLQPHTGQHVLDEDEEIFVPTQTALVKWLRLSIFAQYVEASAIGRALAVAQRILLYKFCSIGYNSQSSSRVKHLVLIGQISIVIGAGGLWLVGSHLFTPH
jgi:hypothetical protein